MPAKKDFAKALDNMIVPTFNLSGDKDGVTKPFGEVFHSLSEHQTESVAIREVEINQLVDNPYQYLARSELDEGVLEKLTNSIRQNGFYGTLLARRKKGLSEQYELAFGHRRREAAQRAGLQTLPVKIVELGDIEMARITASENFAREDLSPIGEANVVGFLSSQQNLSIPQIIQIIGKDHGWVQLRLFLYNAPADIKQMVERKAETLGHIRLLLQITEVSERVQLIEEILQDRLTSSELERRIEANGNLLKPQKDLAENLPVVSTKLLQDNHLVTRITDSVPYYVSDRSNNISSTTSVSSTCNNDISTRQPKANITNNFDTSAENISELENILENLESLVFNGEAALTSVEQSRLVGVIERLTAFLT